MKHAYDNLAECAAWDADEGRAFPPPTKSQTWASYSGRFSVRVPKAVHERLSLEAKRRGVSLNAWVGSVPQRQVDALGSPPDGGPHPPAAPRSAKTRNRRARKASEGRTRASHN